MAQNELTDLDNIINNLDKLNDVDFGNFMVAYDFWNARRVPGAAEFLREIIRRIKAKNVIP